MKKTLLVTSLLLASSSAFSQDTVDAWIDNCHLDQGLSYCQQQAKKYFSGPDGNSSEVTMRIVNSMGTAMQQTFDAMDHMGEGNPEGKSIGEYVEEMVISALRHNESFADIPNYQDHAKDAIEKYIDDRDSLAHPNFFIRLFDDDSFDRNGFAVDYEEALLWRAEFRAGYREPGVYKKNPEKAMRELKDLVAMGKERAKKTVKFSVWPDAEYILALSTLNGVGTDKDPAAALVELQDVARLYDDWAANFPSFNAGEYTDYNTKAVSNALILLTNIYGGGVGVPVDATKADSYARKAGIFASRNGLKLSGTLYDNYSDLIDKYADQQHTKDKACYDKTGKVCPL